jgi:tRNA dimethylallyltransferase
VSNQLVAIVGATASGKSDLAMQVAREHHGEIICADSRTIYKGLDIGTAKPSASDRAEIPHHLIDIVTPDQRYSAVEFKIAAQAAIVDICGRGKLPILVGGTGLYVDAVLYDFEFPAGGNPRQRQTLEASTTAELQSQVDQLEMNLNQSDYSNRPRLIRAIETAGQPRTKKPLRPNTLVVGLDIDLAKLRHRIDLRIKNMVDQGLVEEVRNTYKIYSPDSTGLRAPAYRSFRDYIEGRISINTAADRLKLADTQLAKRQITWFKRSPDIHWFNNSNEAKSAIDRFTAKAV